MSRHAAELADRIIEKARRLARVEAANRCYLIDPRFRSINKPAESRLAGHESLACWNDVELGMFRSDIFIALAEQSGLLGQLVLDRLQDQVDRWR